MPRSVSMHYKRNTLAMGISLIGKTASLYWYRSLSFSCESMTWSVMPYNAIATSLVVTCNWLPSCNHSLPGTDWACTGVREQENYCSYCMQLMHNKYRWQHRWLNASNAIFNARELPQFCAKPLICSEHIFLHCDTEKTFIARSEGQCLKLSQKRCRSLCLESHIINIKLK